MRLKWENQKLKNCLFKIISQAPNSKLSNFQTFQFFNSNILLTLTRINSKKALYIKCFYQEKIQMKNIFLIFDHPNVHSLLLSFFIWFFL